MILQDFNDTIEKQWMKCKRMMAKKADRYAPGDDRLIQFKTAGILQKVTPIKALGGEMVKHTTTLYDLIDGTIPGVKKEAVWDEVISDHINYLFLLKGLLVEKFED